MLSNALGEPVLQPGDSIEDAFADVFNSRAHRCAAWFLESSPDGEWGCEIRDEDENTLLAAGFATQQELASWLTGQGVEIVP